VVETFIARRFHPSLRDRVRSGRPEWCSYLLDAEVPQSAIEHRTIARVAVVNQKSRRPPIPSAAFHYLLGRTAQSSLATYTIKRPTSPSLGRLTFLRNH
jgi:hypothetical protein